jgi:hypothetical protein
MVQVVAIAILQHVHAALLQPVEIGARAARILRFEYAPHHQTGLAPGGRWRTGACCYCCARYRSLQDSFNKIVLRIPLTRYNVAV